MGRHARGEHTFDDTTDPANLTPEQRLGELAAIWAAAVRRLRAQAPAAEESRESRLARCSATRLNGSAGKRPRERRASR